MIYDPLNTYIINRPVFYIHTKIVTFPFYYSTQELNDMYHGDDNRHCELIIKTK